MRGLIYRKLVLSPSYSNPTRNTDRYNLALTDRFSLNMSSFRFLPLIIFSQLWRGCLAQQNQTLLPKPNGTYAVAQLITELVDIALQQPFAPEVEPRYLGVSIFYPVNSSNTTPVPYMPLGTAQAEDSIQSMEFNLTSPPGTFEGLYMQLASNNSPIAPAPSKNTWPVLLFSPAEGTTRHFYNAMNAQIASTGYVIVSFDTPYDTDVFEIFNGSLVLFNQSVAITEENGIIDVNARAQDAAWLLEALTTNTTTFIPGCSSNSCLNTTSVGFYGHSLGGASSATAMANDTHIAGAVNLDGALFGDVVTQGLDRPFMVMATAGQTRASGNTSSQDDSTLSAQTWFNIWPNLRAKNNFDLILADSLHYDYSDLPLVLETLNIHPNDSVLMAELITKDLDGARALNIVTSYTQAFFDFVIKGQPLSPLLQGPSPMFPEISFDNSTGDAAGSGAKAGGGSTTSTSSSSSPSASSKSAAGKILTGPVAVLLAILGAVFLYI